MFCFKSHVNGLIIYTCKCLLLVFELFLMNFFFLTRFLEDTIRISKLKFYFRCYSLKKNYDLIINTFVLPINKIFRLN